MGGLEFSEVQFDALCIVWVIATLILALYVESTRRRSVNARALVMEVSKRLTRNDGLSALRLLEAGAGSPVCAGLHAALSACKRGLSVRGAERADYRQSAIELSRVSIVAALRVYYDRAFDRVDAAPALRAAAGIAGLVVVATAASPIFVRDTPVLLAMLSIGALAALGNAIRLDVRTMRSRGRTFDEVAHDLVRAALDPKVFSLASLVEE